MTDFEARYSKARRAVIEREYMNLNPEQRKAVMATQGPLLLLAGAGSGKTTVLIHRVANLLKYGRGSDCDEVSDNATEEDLAFLENYPNKPTGADTLRAERLCAVEPALPWSIIAITFTNKAAKELKDRLEKMLGSFANDIWACTFHSACVRILRRDIERLGFDKNFTIYDSADSQRVIKDIIKDFKYDDKTFTPRSVLNTISNSKDEMILPEEFAQRAKANNDWQKERVAKIYKEYTKRLKDSNALDFDDIILHAVTLLQQFQEVREYYQHKFRYVLIDEYQDTNHLQYLLASLLAGGRKNICVVGDDDQSIYRFRGANIENILNFESQYKGARTIRLEQNYRSTQNILDAANCVIRNNTGRKGKELWTGNGDGDKVNIRSVYNESEEADFVVGDIIKNGGRLGDNAVLYRMNAQSQQLERAFRANGIKPKVVGGQAFFDRAEVKDMLSYLCVINNPADDLRLRRIINNPPRGIGAKTIDNVQEIAYQEGMPMFQILLDAESYGELGRAEARLTEFAAKIIELQGKAEIMPLGEFYDAVCVDTGYLAALEQKNDIESRSRAENVKELKSSIMGYLENHTEAPSLADFLNEISLFTDLDNFNESEDMPILMTVHAAKGLEFPNVYIVGMEDGIFPGDRARLDEEEMEEERRLCYVAMTRAKEKLTMTCASRRMLFGRTTSNMPSKFLKEIPEENSVWIGKKSAVVDDMPFGDNFGYGGSGASTYAAPAVPSIPSTANRFAGRSQPDYGVTKVKPAAGKLALERGDSVEHTKFGKGMVISVKSMGNDALLEIAFDGNGTKRLMLNTASAYLKKI